MANSIVPKKYFSQTDEDGFQVEIQEEEEGNNQSSKGVTSHICLKPPHTTGSLNKDVVLRRIRHRKQVNKLKSATQSFLGFPFKTSSKNENKVTNSQMIRWVDDAFAAP
ncbi:hypothetical protein A4A49_10332 [Nicotiana attenuata]|uniref:Uncharacterized protein n=1 Tax=Nicotiana attenuata TaxID=49451 RepID=A0A314LB28_NICAT|nr:hypothetical protein A4A49_10332 [Nicotiana attenuata]